MNKQAVTDYISCRLVELADAGLMDVRWDDEEGRLLYRLTEGVTRQQIADFMGLPPATGDTGA